MHHKTALSNDSRHSFIKSSEESTQKIKILANETSSHRVGAAVRIIKDSIGSRDDSPLLFQIGKDDCLYQVVDLKGTCFHQFRRVV